MQTESELLPAVRRWGAPHTPAQRDPLDAVTGHRELAGVGLTFLGLAAFFLWRDLNLGIELVLVPAVALAFAAMLARRPLALPNLGAWALLACAVGGAAWFLAVRPPQLLWGLGATFVAAAVGVLRAPQHDDAARAWAWRALGASFLAFSFALYFEFLTLGLADVLARRLWLTAGWLAVGLALVVSGRWRRRTERVEIGAAIAAVAVLKALAYDTTHLGGGLRVATMLAAGSLLLLAAGAVRLGGGVPEARDV